MMYQAYQTYADMLSPMRMAAGFALDALDAWHCLADNDAGRKIGAMSELWTLAGLTHARPAFGIDRATVNGQEVAVMEEAAFRTPFATMLRFRKDIDTPQPKVLLISPMSGHFATLLRGTVRTMLQDHDVHITDWHNPRDIFLSHGKFGLEDFVRHIVSFIEALGPECHVVAVCQPTVAALAAVALMAEENHPAQPRSLTLMAGPIDTRVNPTEVNRLATSKPINWFERNLIATVPMRFSGAMRRVYPGFLQLLAFMSMNPDRHATAFLDLYNLRAIGEAAKAGAIRAFYEEYFATMDLPADFYLETVKQVFQDHALPLGKLELLGRKVDPAAIRRTALLTVEGERDDICAVGQTVAAQDLCSRLRPYMKTHHVQTGVGHYGVFSGRRWETQVYPRVRDVIHVSR
jgi:polyhydroxyalkanoate depolymerase